MGIDGGGIGYTLTVPYRSGGSRMVLHRQTSLREGWKLERGMEDGGGEGETRKLHHMIRRKSKERKRTIENNLVVAVVSLQGKPRGEKTKKQA